MQHFDCSGKNKTQMYIEATNYELYNFGDYI